MNTELIWEAARNPRGTEARFAVLALQLEAAGIIDKDEARAVLSLDDE